MPQPTPIILTLLLAICQLAANADSSHVHLRKFFKQMHLDDSIDLNIKPNDGQELKQLDTFSLKEYIPDSLWDANYAHQMIRFNNIWAITIFTDPNSTFYDGYLLIYKTSNHIVLHTTKVILGESGQLERYSVLTNENDSILIKMRETFYSVTLYGDEQECGHYQDIKENSVFVPRQNGKCVRKSRTKILKESDGCS